MALFSILRYKLFSLVAFSKGGGYPKNVLIKISVKHEKVLRNIEK